MDFIHKLSTELSTKVFLYLQHPVATMVQDHVAKKERFKQNVVYINRARCQAIVDWWLGLPMYVIIS